MNNVLQRCCSNDNLSHNIKLSQYEIYSNGLKFEILYMYYSIVVLDELYIAYSKKPAAILFCFEGVAFLTDDQSMPYY